MAVAKIEIPLTDDQVLVLETGKIAKSANGSIWASLGDNIVFSAAVMSPEPTREYLGFTPLSVYYNERYYASGRIPGGFIKREGKPKEKEILIARLIDRPIRPLLPKGMMNEVQITSLVLSSDQETPLDVVAAIASSAALLISDIPFIEPVAMVRIAKVGDKYLVNPSYKDLELADMEMVVAGTEKGITMIEGHSNEISEEEFLHSLEIAWDHISRIIQYQKKFMENYAKPKKDVLKLVAPQTLETEIREKYYEQLKQAFYHPNKMERQALVREVEHKALEELADHLDEMGPLYLREIFDNMKYELLRKLVLEDGLRIDGRQLDEIRPISIEVGVLPRAHGSALFTRGETQALASVTLGSITPEPPNIDEAEEIFRRFMLHYHFPGFSVGEVDRPGPASRREIGHGYLAERAFTYLVPSKSLFPYSMKIVSEIMESNGSTSMATVVATSLALFDAGVPMPKHVAGISIGLITSEDRSSFKTLTDIQGLEDALGDMDFKVAGTRDGITSFQLDIKLHAVSMEILKQGLKDARAAREKILNMMYEVIPEPRSSVAEHAPKIITTQIKQEKIRELIGPGGSVVRGIMEKTGTNIVISEDGTVTITGKDQRSLSEAYKMVRNQVADVEMGKTYIGRITRITDYGVFVEIMPGKEGLVHISNIANKTIKRISDILQVGDKVAVKVTAVRPGKIDLTMKGLKQYYLDPKVRNKLK